MPARCGHYESQPQHARAGGVRVVDVGAGRQQPFRGSAITLLRGKQHRSKSTASRGDENTLGLWWRGRHVAQRASLNPIVNVRALDGANRGDRELLRRAFDNVLRNAIHYAPMNSDIEISVRADKKQVALSVRDYGPGVPDELLARIFQPFFRIDVTGGGDGGLALAIVRRIVDLHHGTLKAENAAPALRVTIAVPLAA